MACDDFLTKMLWKNIIVSGGSTVIPGFADRLKADIEKRAPEAVRKDIQIVQDSQRKLSAWIGASMLASLNTFDMLKVSRQEFLESESLLHRKYF